MQTSSPSRLDSEPNSKGAVLAFEAHYDEEGAARAERLFYTRSVIELGRLSTFGPPALLAAVVVFAVLLGAESWFTIFFSVFLVLSVVSPVIFYFARPASARRLARKYPVRQIALTPAGVEITFGDARAAIPWERIKHVWQAGDYKYLILSRYAAIGLPDRSLPEGAHAFILACVARPPDDASHR